MQKYIHAEIYSLSLLGSFVQLNGCGCHGDLSPPPPPPTPTVFLLFSRSGYEWLNARQISLSNEVQQFSLPPVGLLFTFMKETNTEHDFAEMFHLLSRLSTETASEM